MEVTRFGGIEVSMPLRTGLRADTSADGPCAFGRPAVGNGCLPAPAARLARTAGLPLRRLVELPFEREVVAASQQVVSADADRRERRFFVCQVGNGQTYRGVVADAIAGARVEQPVPVDPEDVAALHGVQQVELRAAEIT